MQEDSFYNAKGQLLNRKRIASASQKDSFCKTNNNPHNHLLSKQL